MRATVGSERATTLADLLQALDALTPAGVRNALETTYVTINSDSIKLNLIEETLLDGSKVYNIELSDVCSNVIEMKVR